MRYCIVGLTDYLPPLYHNWAAALHREWRQTFEAALDPRSRMLEAATNLGPLASKELFKLVLAGCFHPNIQKTNNLTTRISPFT